MHTYIHNVCIDYVCMLIAVYICSYHAFQVGGLQNNEI